MKGILTGVSLVGLLIVGGCSKEGVENKVDLQSPFDKECLALNLDLQSTSPFELECTKYGLNPDETSLYGLYATKLGLPVTATPDQIIERKHGFNPGNISSEQMQQELEKLGDRYKIVQDLYTHLLE